jgi:hypothetical protein
MKYWIFQSNQVLGPFEPDDLSKHSAFGAESLVCPEGRKGTTMGDWQRAGMVPDLSIALVRAASSRSTQGSVATLAGLPPEPTLKDLAVLGSLQEKMGMLEDVVLQLQEGLRLKDAELASLHQELAGKDRQSSAMKAAMEAEAAELKLETETRKREAEELQAQTSEFKAKMAELEERVCVVNRLSETVDKAVEAEKTVQHDVEAQGAVIAELTKEIESLRAQLSDRLASASGAPATSAPAAPASKPDGAPLAGAASDAGWGNPPAPGDLPSLAPTPAAAPSPAADLEISIPGDPAAPPPSPAQTPSPAPAEPAAMFAPGEPLPTFSGAMPSFGAPPAPSTAGMPLDPMSGIAAGASSAAAGPAPFVDAAAKPEGGGRKKTLLLGLVAVVAILGAGAYFSGVLNPPKKKPAIPASLADAPLPTPTLPPPAPATPAAPAVDPRESAISAAREWELPDGRRLGNALETLSPPIGNLSPWMAEPLTEGRVSVNYFAHGGASGAPTVAYEFEVDLAAKTVIGRNPAAKAVLQGKATPPPAPPKAKKIAIKPKAKAKAAAPKPKVKEESLDSLLGTDAPPAPEASPAKAPEAAASKSDGVDDLIAPSEDAPPKPAKPTAAKRAAKASAKAAPKEGKAADEALLDDILKE